MSHDESIVKRRLTTEMMVQGLCSRMVIKGDIRFAEISESLKVCVLVNKETKELKILSDSEALEHIKSMAKDLKESYETHFKNPEMLWLTASSALTTLRTAAIDSRLTLKDVKTFSFKSDTSYTFCKIPFDPFDSIQPTPHWDKFLNNFTNRLAIRMWIGSLFFLDSNRSQYLWLYGPGGNGKSTLARVISSVIKQFVRHEHVPSKDDKFWSYGLIGKRLVVLDDCNHYGFVKTGFFKSLTGSSWVRVEQKGKDSYDAELNCKFLFTSNEMPAISTEIADQRRIIFSSAIEKNQFEFSNTLEQELISEMPKFISNCMNEYKLNCGDGRPIPVDNTEAMELGRIFDEEIEAWFERSCEVNKVAVTKVHDLRQSFEAAKLKDRRVYKYLKSRGFERENIRFGNLVLGGYRGFSLKVLQFGFNNKND